MEPLPHAWGGPRVLCGKDTRPWAMLLLPSDLVLVPRLGDGIPLSSADGDPLRIEHGVLAPLADRLLDCLGLGVGLDLVAGAGAILEGLR